REGKSTRVPRAKCLPLFATQSVEEFGFAGASHPVGPSGRTHPPAHPWASQAKTGGPVCQFADLPVPGPSEGAPKAHGGRRLSCSRPIRLSPSARERLPFRNKFRTYVSWAIKRRFSRSIEEDEQHVRHCPVIA